MMEQLPLDLRPRRSERERSMHPAAAIARCTRRDRQRAAELGHAKAQRKLAEWRAAHRADLQAALDRKNDR